MMEPESTHNSRGLAVRLLLVFLLLHGGVPPVAADEVPAVPAIEPVVVTGTVASDVSGMSVLGKKQIATLPAGDGNVGDLVKLMPGVQISDSANTSFKGGEITPPLLSISGGRPYQNNFRIDGMGNNSLIDPIEDNPHKFDRLPGHPEEIFLNSRLVQTATVYDHNVPARFGGFSGGVVDIETIDPADEFSGAVYYKTTRDTWTEFHIDPDEQNDFVQSATYVRQPVFRKHSGGFDVSAPLAAETGLLLSYQFLYSEIPLVFLNEKTDQRRFSQNLLAKLVHEPTETDRFSLQAIYSPYEGRYFTKDTLRGDFTIKGGGMSLSGGYEKKTRVGSFEFAAGVRTSENSRDAEKDFFTWTNSPSKNWGSLVGSSTSKEGGFGDIDIIQDSLEATIDYSSPKFESGDGSHVVSAGLAFLSTRGRYDRHQTSYSYRTSVPSSPPEPATACGADTVACLPAEQYLRRRSVYGESHSSAELNQFAFYLEDLFRFRRMEIRPGVRLSQDDLMDNFNVEPRLAGAYDLFGDGETKFVGGWNRYYGRTLLTYKLREGIALQELQSRTTVVDNTSEWTTTSTILAGDQFSRLKTPFVDEIVAGIDHYVWGGTASLRYLQRDGEDEFARERDPFVSGVIRYARLNNNGKSHYESCRFSWERQWQSQFLGFNITYEKATTTHGDYDDTLLVDDLDDQVWFDGGLIYRDELPREDYNRPWEASLLYSVSFPGDVTFSNVTHFRDGYKNIEDSGSQIDVGGTFYDVYAEFNRSSSTIFDWRVDWIPTVVPGKSLTLTLEVFNVFDKKVFVGGADDEYELGRQFWLGAEYRF